MLVEINTKLTFFHNLTSRIPLLWTKKQKMDLRLIKGLSALPFLNIIKLLTFPISVFFFFFSTSSLSGFWKSALAKRLCVTSSMSQKCQSSSFIIMSKRGSNAREKCRRENRNTILLLNWISLILPKSWTWKVLKIGSQATAPDALQESDWRSSLELKDTHSHNSAYRRL